MAYPAGPARPVESSYEPELEGSSYQTAPITSLALARWPWAAAGALAGLAVGFILAGGGGFQATASLQMTPDANGNPNDLATQATTLQAMATSDDVLDAAIIQLKRNADFTKAVQLPTKVSDQRGYLGSKISALYAANTSIVTVTVTDASGAVAGWEANAVVKAVAEQVKVNADQAISEATAEAKALINNNTIGSNTSSQETSRLQAIGTAAGNKQAQAGTSKSSVRAIQASLAIPAGPSQNVSALLGGAGGAFLGALVAVGAGAGRRRIRSPRELVALAPDLTVRSTVQAGEMAGRIMETDRRTVVVLALPDTRFPATQLAMAVAHHLRTHGATVAVVDRVSEFTGSAAEDRLWALRRDVRRNIPLNFQADMLVVVCNADEEALSLIAGQSDLLVAVVAKQRKTVLADIRRTVDAVRTAEPVVVLAR